MRLKRYLLPATLAAGVFLAGAALAANFGLDTAAGNAIPHTSDISEVIGKLIKTALGFVGTIFLILMVYAGFLWMTAGGEAKKIDQAKQMITGAIIGVVIIAGAYAITSFVLTAATGQNAAESSTSSGIPLGGECHNTSDCAGSLACTDGKCSEI